MFRARRKNPRCFCSRGTRGRKQTLAPREIPGSVARADARSRHSFGRPPSDRGRSRSLRRLSLVNRSRVILLAILFVRAVPDPATVDRPVVSADGRDRRVIRSARSSDRAAVSRRARASESPLFRSRLPSRRATGSEASRASDASGVPSSVTGEQRFGRVNPRERN